MFCIKKLSSPWRKTERNQTGWASGKETLRNLKLRTFVAAIAKCVIDIETDSNGERDS